MTARPIIFSGGMVKALLAGEKTQTRRILKPQPAEGELIARGLHYRFDEGDRLWVRETVQAEEREDGEDVVFYPATDDSITIANSEKAADDWHKLFSYRKGRGLKVPAIHMPRWASRITLTVTDVRVQQLQDITEADALAEGISTDPDKRPLAGVEEDLRFRPGQRRKLSDKPLTMDPRRAFKALWNIINGKKAPWNANPWVVAVTFTVEKAA